MLEARSNGKLIWAVHAYAVQGKRTIHIQHHLLSWSSGHLACVSKESRVFM